MMLLRNYSWLLKSSNLLIIRHRCSDKQSLAKTIVPTGFIWQVAKLLDIDLTKCREIISQHRKILSIKFEDIEESVRALQALNYTQEQIQANPPLLYTSASALQNRHKILSECGCVKITAGILSKYLVVMNRPIRIIKSHGVMLDETNVVESLIQSFRDIQFNMPPIDDNKLLKIARELVLNMYLQERLKMTEADIKKTWHSYYRIRHRSFESIEQMIKILITDLNFPLDRIIKNGFVLYGDPDNVRHIIADIKQIGNEDIREVLYRRPKVMMAPTDCIKKIIEHITSYGIAEDSIIKCLDVLTLSPDTVLERLQHMDRIEEFRALKSNPRIVRLLHYQPKARLRLEYLNQFKIKCASLHVLSSHTDAFERYTKDGSDKGKGCDTINYISGVFKRSPAEVRDIITRHPNWCHLPTITITHSYEFLISKLFSNDDIFSNLQILLYPIARIKAKLEYLQSDEAYSEMKLSNGSVLTISNQQMLALCLYLIEREFHFTGDGIWTEQDLHPVENFNNILPDFPTSWQRGYKFGTRPTILSKIDEKNEIQLSMYRNNQ